jgi:anti-anti-sigma factor
MSGTHGTHWLERDDVGNVTIVRFKTPQMLDEDIIRTVFEPINTIVAMGRTQLVLNLAAVKMLPSMALGKLVMLNRKVEAGHGRLALCQLSEDVAVVLETTHLNTLFNIHASEQDALQYFP